MADVVFKDTSGVIWKNTIGVNWDRSGVLLLSQVKEDLEKVYDNLAAVTPSDSSNLTDAGILYIGVGGDVKVDTMQFGTVTLLNIPNGVFIRIRVKKVYAAGTTAGSILVLF